MAKDNDSAKNALVENVDAIYLPLLRDADKILSTLSKIWTYSHVAIFTSLYFLGFISIVAYFLYPANDRFLQLGEIFVIIAIVVVLVHFGRINRRRRAEMAHWKFTLASYIKPDNTINSQQNGESILENLMKVILASDRWISRIKRRIIMMLVWQTVAVVVFFMVAFQVSSFQVGIIEECLVVYSLGLAIAVYYGVNWRFRSWQSKVNKFKSSTSSAMDRL
jgi:hypothetical protein